MNRLTNRALALLLVLALCISMLPGMAMAASVSYVTGTVMDKDNAKVVAENVIKNWGVRGETATFLSPNAVAFYEKNSVTYDSLAAMAGSGDLGTLADSDLYKALNALVVSNHTTITSYDDTRTMYSYTDCQNSDITNLTCFYSGSALNPVWDSGATWSREHIFPDSKSVDDKREADIMVLRPVNKSLNSSRGNAAYGESDGFYKLADIAVEDIDVRGDVARNFLHNLVRWGTELVYPNTDGSYKSDTTTGVMTWGNLGVFESKEILVSWMTADPVDTWEMGRNDSVESITGTRNVFVDYPELAYVLLGEEIPADLTSPSGEGYVSTYTITATANNDAYGTVEVNGNKVTAFPTENYEVAGYEVTAGTATVTQSGNIFTVEASADCTVQINFQLKADFTVTYYENGTETKAVTVKDGDAVTLPDKTLEVEGFTFVGWMDSQLTQTTQVPTYYAVGDTLTVTADTTIYALYTRFDANAEGALVYKLVESVDQLAVNKKVVIAAVGYDKALSTNQKSNNRGAAAITKDAANKTITFGDDVAVLTLGAGTTDGTYSFNTGDGYLYAASSSGNYLRTQANLNANASFKITITNGVAAVVAQGSYTRNTMRYNTGDLFACYAVSNTMKDICLYVGTSEGATYYSTGTQACEHANATAVAEQPATCTEPGYTAGTYCSDCQSYPTGHKVIEALGHSYDAGVVTEPTWEYQGYTTYTCANCGDSYKSNYVDALQWTQTISFSVPAGVETVADITSTYNGFTMPAAGDIEGYTFEGWATETVNNVTAAPTLYKAGSTHGRTNAPLTFYAVYSYSEGGSGEVAWKLVTSADQLAAGAKLVLASNAKGFVASSISSQYMTQVAATFSDDKSTLTAVPDGAVVLTLGGTAGAWTLANDAGQLLGATAVKKVAWGSGTTTWSISLADGNATIQNTTSSYGRFLHNVTSTRFTTYTSNTSSSMLLPQLYVQTGDAGVKYYTTVIVTGCEHEYVGDLCCKCQIVGDGENNYASIADALAETGSDYLYLNFDLTEDVTVDGDLILDLNGKTLTGDIEILDGASLQLFDSATADYTYENRGKVEGSITGNLVRAMNTPGSYGHNYKYLTICEEDGSYSAHRIYLTVKSVSLAPCIKDGAGKGSAIRYKTLFKCSELVTRYVESYGVVLTGDETVTEDYGMTLAAGENWGTVRLDCTLSTNNTDEVNAANAVADVAVSARIVLKDGTELVSAAVTRSLQDLVVYANGVEDLTDLQKKALSKMYTLFSGVMEGWEIPNIKSYAN